MKQLEPNNHMATMYILLGWEPAGLGGAWLGTIWAGFFFVVIHDMTDNRAATYIQLGWALAGLGENMYIQLGWALAGQGEKSIS